MPQFDLEFQIKPTGSEKSSDESRSKREVGSEDGSGNGSFEPMVQFYNRRDIILFGGNVAGDGQGVNDSNF